jgi:hypothetical protein
MPSSEMLRRVTAVRADVSEECISSIIRVTRISEVGTTLAITSNRSTLPRNTIVYIEIHSIYFSILVFLRSVLRVLITVNVVPSSSILVTLII